MTVNHASNLHPNRASSACGLAADDLDGHANLLAATTPETAERVDCPACRKALGLRTLPTAVVVVLGSAAVPMRVVALDPDESRCAAVAVPSVGYVLVHPARPDALITTGHPGDPVVRRPAAHDDRRTTVELLAKAERLDLRVTWPEDWPT